MENKRITRKNFSQKLQYCTKTHFFLTTRKHPQFIFKFTQSLIKRFPTQFSGIPPDLELPESELFPQSPLFVMITIDIANVYKMAAKNYLLFLELRYCFNILLDSIEPLEQKCAFCCLTSPHEGRAGRHRPPWPTRSHTLTPR